MLRACYYNPSSNNILFHHCEKKYSYERANERYRKIIYIHRLPFEDSPEKACFVEPCLQKLCWCRSLVVAQHLCYYRWMDGVTPAGNPSSQVSGQKPRVQLWHGFGIQGHRCGWCCRYWLHCCCGYRLCSKSTLEGPHHLQKTDLVVSFPNLQDYVLMSTDPLYRPFLG